MSNRWTILPVLGALALAAGACDEDASGGISGRYALQVFESRDTCDGTNNSFGLDLVVEHDDPNVTLTFGDEWQLTGTFDNEGVLQADGTVDGEGLEVTTLQVQVSFFRQGLEGNGRVTYVGTFPEVEEECQQDIVFTGDKAGTSLAPVLMTGPAAR